MILLQPTTTPKTIYHIISGTIRYDRNKPLPIIEKSLYLLCQYYEQTYNIDRDYTYTQVVIPALTNILGDRYLIYKALTQQYRPQKFTTQFRNNLL